MTSFADHFSHVARDYATHRPRYPDALFQWLAGVVPARGPAWDCATGSGQAARALASRFPEVVATDPSTAQLAQAPRAFRVHYVACTAERAAIASNTMVLATVAQALHWFDREAFYAEVRRVLVRGGVVAVWSYRLAELGDPTLDAALQRFHGQTVGPYWPAERALVDAGYAHLEFPFDELRVPPFAMEAWWTIEQMAGYVGTWSAVQRARSAMAADPLPALVESLRPTWGSHGSTRLVRWPLEIRVGRV